MVIHQIPSKIMLCCELSSIWVLQWKTEKTLPGRIIIKKQTWGAWVAQLVKCLTVDFGSGHDPRVVGWSPVLGSVLGVDPAWDSLSPSAPLTPACAHFLSKILNK